jgi:hypothetical protein
MPLALLGAMAVRPKVGAFCACMFSVAFLLHSAAGTKEEQYIYYAIPFFCTIWGIRVVPQ